MGDEGLLRLAVVEYEAAYRAHFDFMVSVEVFSQLVDAVLLGQVFVVACRTFQQPEDESFVI